MGQDGERRNKYSAAVIDGIKRKSRILVGDSIVVVCLPGARIEHVTERVEQIMGRGNGGPYWHTSGRTTQTRKEQQQ